MYSFTYALTIAFSANWSSYHLQLSRVMKPALFLNLYIYPRICMYLKILQFSETKQINRTYSLVRKI